MTTQQDDIQAVLAADDARYLAMTSANLEALDAILTSDFTYTHSTAVTDNKAYYLETIRNGKVKYLSADRKEAHVRVKGNVAICHGHVLMQAEVDNKPKRIDSKFLSVWVSDQGTWRMAAWASTLVPPPAN